MTRHTSQTQISQMCRQGDGGWGETSTATGFSSAASRAADRGKDSHEVGQLMAREAGGGRRLIGKRGFFYVI